MLERGKVERIELFHVDVPLPTPYFPAWIPGFHQNRQHYTLLRVTTRDGLVGHATGVAFDREREGIGEFIGQFLLGIDPYDLDQVGDRLRQSSIVGWRNAWMEVAFWDLAAQRQGLPLYQLLIDRSGLPASRSPSRTVAAYASLGELRAPKVRAETLERALRLGHRAVKLSVTHSEAEADLELIAAARAVLGPEPGLMLHAHQTSCIELVDSLPRWDLARALRTAEAAACHGCLWLQDPLRPERFDDLRTLREKSRVPIAAGDTATSGADLRVLALDQAASVLTPDVGFIGFRSLSRLFQRFLDSGLGFSPSTYGDGLALTANLHALVAWSALEGAKGPFLLEVPWEPPAIVPELRDVLLSQPLSVNAEGQLSAPSAPGLGVELDPRALKRYARSFYTLTPVRFLVSSARRAGLRQAAAIANPSPERQERRRERGQSQPPTSPPSVPRPA